MTVDETSRRCMKIKGSQTNTKILSYFRPTGVVVLVHFSNDKSAKLRTAAMVVENKQKTDKTK